MALVRTLACPGRHSRYGSRRGELMAQGRVNRPIPPDREASLRIAPSVRIISRVAALLAALAAGLGSVPATAAGQGARVVHGVTRDSASGLPLAGALVDLRGATLRRTDRSDEEGNFRIGGVPAGRYSVSVLRIGYAELKTDVEVVDGDVVLSLAMRPIPQSLNAFRVRGDISAIYGIVGTLPDLKPLAGARIQVLGANTEYTTDSTGGFFLPTGTAGTFLVRITREGYAERFFPIDVPRNRAVEASRLLDPGTAPPKGLDVVFKDLDQRLRMRSTSVSAIVPGAEVRKGGGQLIDALRASPSFNAHGLRISDTVCVFVNGVPRPNVTLEAFDLDEIESVEAYGTTFGGTGDRSRSLELMWPPNAPCGVSQGRTFTRSPNSIKVGIVKYVVIWLRK